jgi:hypothetical protein
MIRYCFHPDRAFLRRGAMRTFFQVAQDWRRFSFTDVMAVALIVIWQLHEQRHILADFSFGTVIVAAFLSCALAAVMLRAVNAAVRVGALWFGVKARPMPTDVTILPGRSIRCRDLVETTFDWSSLSRWRRYHDMYVLMFATSPVCETPVFISRSHLGAHDANLAVALEAHRPVARTCGLSAQAA